MTQKKDKVRGLGNGINSGLKVTKWLEVNGEKTLPLETIKTSIHDGIESNQFDKTSWQLSPYCKKEDTREFKSKNGEDLAYATERLYNKNCQLTSVSKGHKSLEIEYDEKYLFKWIE